MGGVARLQEESSGAVLGHVEGRGFAQRAGDKVQSIGRGKSEGCRPIGGAE